MEGCKVWGLGFGVEASEFMAWGILFSGVEFGVHLWVQGVDFEVEDFGFKFESVWLRV